MKQDRDNVEQPKTPRGVVGKRAKLSFKQRPGYYRRNIINEPAKVQAYLEAGYSIVRDSGDVDLAKDSDGRGPMTKSVGNGFTGILVEIPMEDRETALEYKRQAHRDVIQGLFDHARREGLEANINFGISGKRNE